VASLPPETENPLSVALQRVGIIDCCMVPIAV
jgi:hypothetical protein